MPPPGAGAGAGDGAPGTPAAATPGALNDPEEEIAAHERRLELESGGLVHAPAHVRHRRGIFSHLPFVHRGAHAEKQQHARKRRDITGHMHAPHLHARSGIHQHKRSHRKRRGVVAAEAEGSVKEAGAGAEAEHDGGNNKEEEHGGGNKKGDHNRCLGI